MQAKQTSTKSLVKQAVFIQGFLQVFQSYLYLFTVLYFMPQEYHTLAAPCTHLWFHAVLLLSCCLCLKHPPLCQVPSSSVPMPRHPSTHHSASISLKVSLRSEVKLGASPLCSQNIYCRMLTLDTDIICFCLSPNQYLQVL